MDFDVAIIGAGPAGMQAAIQASRKKVSAVVLGKSSGSALDGAHISNYFGVGETDGTELLASGREGAEAAGAVFMDQNVVSAAKDGDAYVLELEGGETVHCKALVVATGNTRKKLGIPGEKELFGKGVSYCAVCDCNFYKGRRVVVVGNDSEAASSAEMLTGYASETTWVYWDLKAVDSSVERARAAGVTIVESKPVSIEGDGKVQSMTLENGAVIQTDGVFIELGAKSAADLVLDLGVMPEMDDTIKVDRNCYAGVPGLYACGDVTGKPWQLAKAVGEGLVAGSNASDYVRGLK